MQNNRSEETIRIHCWQMGETVVAASDAAPGIIAAGRDANEAASRYGELIQRLGPTPGISLARPRQEPTRQTGLTGALYLGFPMDSNFGDRWVYRALQNRLPEVELAFRAATLEERWSFALPQTRFSACLLGGGTLINQQSHFYKEARYALGCGMPMLCFGTGVGEPERWGDHRSAWVDLLSQFRYVGVRGPRAVRLLADAGLSSHVAVGDPCLLDDFNFDKPGTGRPSRVALDLSFSAMETRGSSSFRYLLLNWLSELERDGNIAVELYSTWDVYLRWTEAQVEQIFGYRKPVTLLRDNPGDLPCADLAIAYRLHAAAAALVRGIPTVVVNYEDKCADFMEYLGIPEWVVEPCPEGFHDIQVLLGEDMSTDLAGAGANLRDALIAAKAATDEKFMEFRSAFPGMGHLSNGG